MAVFRQRVLEVDDPNVLRRRFYGESVHIRLAEVTDAICQAVVDLPFVDQLAERTERDITITLDDLAAHNPDIVRALVGAGADVLFVEEVKQSMEQLYMDILEREDAQAAGEGA